MLYDDDYWMGEAIKEAKAALEKGEVPIGAVIVAGRRIVGRGHNMTETLRDVTAHAEMLAITSAENALNKYLEDCTLYVTVEPCLMCAGAIGWSHIKRIVYGAPDVKKGYSVFIDSDKTPFHPKSIIIKGVMEKECRALITNFFLMKRPRKE